MQVRITWLVRGRIIFSQAAGDLTDMDYDEYVAEIAAFFAEASGELHFVQDLRYMTQPNMNLGNVRRLLRVVRDFDGWYLQFGQHENPLVQFLALVTARLLGIRTQPMYKEYASLRHFLMNYDPSLNIPEAPPLLFTREELRKYVTEDRLME